MQLFKETIDGWNSWGEVYQSLKAFRPMVEYIYQRHNLPCPLVQNLTPGTNAVFRVEDTVIKIFAPDESGVIYSDAELQALRHAQAAGVPGPKILADGKLKDRYIFHYIIMEYVRGIEAGDALPLMGIEEKRQFVLALKELTKRLNVPLKDAELPDDVGENVIRNHRFRPLPRSLYEEAVCLAESLDKSKFVYVHGDLTGENVLIEPNGTPRIIDFGDSHIAPPSYEYPPLVFELFKGDPESLKLYFDDYCSSSFVRTLADAVLLHDFGADFIMNACKELGTPLESIVNRETLCNVILEWLGENI